MRAYKEGSLSAKELIDTMDALEEASMTEEELLLVTGIEPDNDHYYELPTEWK